jgi:hypothetical protein
MNARACALLWAAAALLASAAAKEEFSQLSLQARTDSLLWHGAADGGGRDDLDHGGATTARVLTPTAA